MSINEIGDFIFENYYKRMGFIRKTVIINKTLEKEKRFVVACEQINGKTT